MSYGWLPRKARLGGAENWHRLADGTQFLGMQLVALLSREGDAAAFVNVVRDVTGEPTAQADQERLAGEPAQAQCLETVGRLAGGIAHD